MKLSLPSQNVILEWDQTLAFQGDPKLVLNGMLLIISDYNHYQTIHLDYAVTGSLRFMMGENDVMAFQEPAMTLRSIELQIPFDIKIEVDAFELQHIQQGSLKALNIPNDFWLQYTDAPRYYQGNDFLILHYQGFHSSIARQAIQLTPDFFLFHEDNQIIGWGLRNCSQYLYDQNRQAYDLSAFQQIDLLSQFFALYKEETFEKILEKDTPTIEAFRRRCEQAKKTTWSAFCDAIEDWLS